MASAFEPAPDGFAGDLELAENLLHGEPLVVVQRMNLEIACVGVLSARSQDAAQDVINRGQPSLCAPPVLATPAPSTGNSRERTS